jgi:hypothetical protein
VKLHTRTAIGVPDQVRHIIQTCYAALPKTYGLWKARKTVVLFSALPTNLGNRKSRFSPFLRRDDEDDYFSS